MGTRRCTIANYPAWATKDAWACYVATRTIFQIHKRLIDSARGEILLADRNDHPYPLRDCEEFSPHTHLARGKGVLICGAEEAIVTFAGNFLVIEGSGVRKVIKFRDSSESSMDPDVLIAMTEKSARSLARAFDGAVYDYPEDLENAH